MPSRFVMFVTILFIAFAIASVPAGAWAQRGPAQPRKAANVLYIGNSYTYSHGMPTVVSAMARSAGSPRQLHAREVTIPGATLQQHWESGAAKRAIHERKWDYVVLQEQSMLPIEQRERMYSYVRLFDNEIRLSGARTVLFVTWARRENPESQAALDAAYTAVAEELGALVAPVGPAWAFARLRIPGVQLYEGDGSHPTPVGAYLTACVLYLAMQAQDQCPAIARKGFSQDAVDSLRSAATSALATTR